MVQKCSYLTILLFTALASFQLNFIQVLLNAVIQKQRYKKMNTVAHKFVPYKKII